MSWHPLQFLIAMCAGSLQRRQQTLVEYLIEENLVLRKKLGPKRLRFTDAERRRLALKAHSLGRKMLDKYATLAALGRPVLRGIHSILEVVHPDTLLRWYQKLIAEKCDGSKLCTIRVPGSSPGGCVAISSTIKCRSFSWVIACIRSPPLR